MFPIRTILFGTDFSRCSEDAFDLACALARDYKARLIVAHVKTFPTIGYGEFGAIPPGAEEDPAATKALLTAMKPKSGDIDVRYVLAEGDPASELVRLASETPCDLIIVGSHGRTGLGRLLLGSVAEVVVRRAPCPVLTIKRPIVVPEAKLKAVMEPTMT